MNSVIYFGVKDWNSYIQRVFKMVLWEKISVLGKAAYMDLKSVISHDNLAWHLNFPWTFCNPHVLLHRFSLRNNKTTVSLLPRDMWASLCGDHFELFSLVFGHCCCPNPLICTGFKEKEILKCTNSEHSVYLLSPVNIPIFMVLSLQKQLKSEQKLSFCLSPRPHWGLAGVTELYFPCALKRLFKFSHFTDGWSQKW